MEQGFDEKSFSSTRLSMDASRVPGSAFSFTVRSRFQREFFVNTTRQNKNAEAFFLTPECRVLAIEV